MKFIRNESKMNRLKYQGVYDREVCDSITVFTNNIKPAVTKLFKFYKIQKLNLTPNSFYDI
jgi:hypothetical protein